MTDVTIKNQAGQTFTFLNAELTRISSRISSTPDVDPLPSTPPGGAFSFDLSGAVKFITINGMLLDSTGSNRVSGGTTVETILQQKRWLEALHTGNQSPVAFTSNYESYTFAGSGTSSTDIDNFVDGTGALTYVMVIDITFEEVEAVGGKLPFTLKLACGSLT